MILKAKKVIWGTRCRITFL